MKTKQKFIRLLIVLALLFSAVGSYYYSQRNEVSTDDATIDARILTISPKIQGYVKTLHIQDNQLVQAGDVLLEIDPADYIIKRNKAKANLVAAQAAANAASNNMATTNVSAPANLDSVQAQVTAAAATWEKSLADRQRMEMLYNGAAISRQQLDQAVATEKADRANLAKLQANLVSAQTVTTVIAAAQDTVEQLQAQLAQAQTDLAQAELDLANTKIIAPMNGRLTKRSVEVGTYVQAGQQLGSLVSTEIWVTANFKENQLTHMQPGQNVKITIDAFPSLQLTGKIDSLQTGTGSRFSLFPAENATGNFVKTVQRVPVKIVFDTPPDQSLCLGPGMSVIPIVDTKSAGLKL